MSRRLTKRQIREGIIQSAREASARGDHASARALLATVGISYVPQLPLIDN